MIQSRKSNRVALAQIKTIAPSPDEDDAVDPDTDTGDGKD